MLIGEILQRFENGDLELDCPTMTVRQNATDKPITYSGPGFIRQRPDRALEFRLFCTSRTNAASPPSLLLADPRTSAGQLIPDDHYYSLTACDLAGREWHSDRIDLDESWGHDQSLVVSGKPHSIAIDQAPTEPPGVVRMIVFADVDIPRNAYTHQQITIGGERDSERAELNVAKFSACGCAFQLTKLTGKLTIEVETDEPLIEHIETRVIEALQFVLGRSLWWSLLRKVTDGVERVCLRAERGKSAPRLHPPINFHRGLVTASTWSLLDKFLGHIWNHRSDRFHPLSAWLHSVRDANAASIFTFGLALGVAIEGVLNNEFDDLGVTSPDSAAKIHNLRSFIGKWDGDENLRARAEGAVENFLTPSASDRLYVLRDRGVVTRKQIKAWKQLRNKSAHANPPDGTELQTWINLCASAEVMLYHLIFAAIGYSGEYTDYSAIGNANWPTRQFDPARASSPPN